MNTEKAANLLSRATGACPHDTSRSDFPEIDGWEPKGGCTDVCGLDGRGGQDGSTAKCWHEWMND